MRKLCFLVAHKQLPRDKLHENFSNIFIIKNLTIKFIIIFNVLTFMKLVNQFFLLDADISFHIFVFSRNFYCTFIKIISLTLRWYRPGTIF